MKTLLRSSLFRSGALLAVSAVVSKLFGLWRDRLFVQIFAESGQVDVIFAAFRIPDFFFFLLIGGTVSTLFLPRMASIERPDHQIDFASSFLWLTAVCFGLVCVFGMLLADFLTPIFAAGFSAELQGEITTLARFLFGSVFLLSLSSVFAAFLQNRGVFWSVAIAPIIYTVTICIGTWHFAPTFGVISVGVSALIGSLLHCVFNFFASVLQKQEINFSWLKPASAWKNFSADFFLRVGNASALQINQSVDVLIASFLVAGTVTAFAVGTNLGHVLLSIVGLSVANIVFPRLTQHKKDPAKQQWYLLRGLGVVFLITVPVSVFLSFFSAKILQFLYAFPPDILVMADTVFRWTVWSLPFACALPLLSRAFLANDDTVTPMRCTLVSLFVATSLAAFLSLNVFVGSEAILGLAIGNFVANTLSFLFFSWFWWRRIS